MIILFLTFGSSMRVFRKITMSVLSQWMHSSARCCWKGCSMSITSTKTIPTRSSCISHHLQIFSVLQIFGRPIQQLRLPLRALQYIAFQELFSILGHFHPNLWRKDIKKLPLLRQPRLILRIFLLNLYSLFKH